MSEFSESDEIYEVKGRGKTWKVWYPDEGAIMSEFPVYDKEGKLKTIIWAGGDPGKLTESFVEFSTKEEAVAYAEELGAEKIKITTIQERKKKKND